jgi:CO/xanthine dehydrogenase Mo-binding subunit
VTETLRVIGRPTRRLDGPEKLVAATHYAADLAMPGLLHARLVLSPHAHARILHIDAAAALRLPGVVAVLTATDLPIRRVDDLRKSDPLARDLALWVGQPVAIVVAESERVAEDAAQLVEVSYEPLPAVLDPVAAMAADAPSVRPRVVGGTGAESAHGTVGSGDDSTDSEPLSANVANAIHHRRGDMVRGFAEASIVIEHEFHTSAVYQCYLEPQTATAAVDPLGALTVWASTQSVFYTRQQLALSLGLPVTRVRIVAMPLGGGFGGKVLLVEPLAAAAALTLQRPVRLTFTRGEDFLAGNPANAVSIRLKVGARADGTLIALQGHIVADAGAFPEWSPAGLAALALGGFYRCPNLDVRAYDVMTHRPGAGSYRAPGAPQGTFAIESTLDELARTLGMDPIELRLRNAVREGDAQVDGTPWGRIGLVECLERLRAEAARLPAPVAVPGSATGTGVAIGGWPGGLEPAAALCSLDQDGSLSVVTGSVDMSGSNTTLGLIAAEVLGLTPDRVRVVSEDSQSAPYAGMTGGSKITYTVGRAVQHAAEDAHHKIVAIAADLLEASVDDILLEGGRASVVGAPDRSVTFEEIAATVYNFGSRFEPVQGHGASAITTNAAGFVAHLARVSVDLETGRTRVTDYVAVQDVGRALNPAAVDGQIFGGVAQGVGWALYEGMPYDEHGQPLAASFADYAVPTADRVPNVKPVLVEIPSADGPFGAKGVGEPPVVPGAAVIANAIASATGVRITQLPATSERVFRALHTKT